MILSTVAKCSDYAAIPIFQVSWLMGFSLLHSLILHNWPIIHCSSLVTAYSTDCLQSCKLHVQCNAIGRSAFSPIMLTGHVYRPLISYLNHYWISPNHLCTWQTSLLAKSHTHFDMYMNNLHATLPLVKTLFSSFTSIHSHPTHKKSSTKSL